ncbi:MAG: DUF523 domain-containing protein [Lachnospiraceae bacterium]|nr:DUF523 domain-containing protein [Lachnospiraceae bacterium]
MKEEKNPAVLVSACLLGVSCRYDGSDNGVPAIMELGKRCRLIPVCPEQMGGLMTPRLPAERREGGVYTKDGADVTEPFQKGAEETLKLAQLFGCKCAVLKARSPSCGSGMIYDGTFSGRKIEGDGVTAALLKENGIRVYTENEAEQAFEID